MPGVCGVIILLYSILLSKFNSYSHIDFRIIAIMSLVPFSFIMVSLIPWFVKRIGRLRLVMSNITSILLVVLLNNGYLIYVVLTR